jgi:hypothetical protein
MTTSDPAIAWLESRRPPAPPALARRLRAAIEEGRRPGDGDVADRCLEAGERVLASLLGRDCATRDAAIDLLAADALITYAFEAASDEPASLEPRARRAMARLAALAEQAAARGTT